MEVVEKEDGRGGTGSWKRELKEEIGRVENLPKVFHISRVNRRLIGK